MMTLQNFAAVWRSGSGGKKVSERWATDRRRLLKRLLLAHGDLPFEALRPKHLWRISDSIRDAGLSEATVNRTLAATLAFVRDAEREEEAPPGTHALILAGVDMARERPGDELVPWNLTDRNKILAGAARLKPSWHRYIAFLFMTGCRTSEALGLRRKHLFLAEHSVSIVESRSEGVRGDGKNEHAIREIPLPLELVTILSTLPDLEPDDLVFCGPQGKPINERSFRRKTWWPLIERVGVRRGPPRCARHTYCSLAIANGLWFDDLSVLTGDKVTMLEGRYARYVGDRRQIDVDRAVGTTGVPGRPRAVKSGKPQSTRQLRPALVTRPGPESDQRAHSVEFGR